MLDARLALALSLYDPVSLGADIGTDHAHLPIALLRCGICERMLLTDISQDALNNARNNIRRAGLEDRVEYCLGDGLTPLREACGYISILGMGGRTIRQILLHGENRLQGAGLVLSAHTDLPLVRQALVDIGYHPVSETPCSDAGRFYLMLKALPGPEEMSPREIRLGSRSLFQSSSPALSPYLAHQIQVLEKKRTGLLQSSRPEENALAQLEEDLVFLRTQI